MFVLSFVVALSAVGQMHESVPKQLHDAIVRGGYSRVGVLPRFLCREGGREQLGGSIGPEADYVAENLEEALVNQASGQFRVVDGRQMRQAFGKLKIDDLGNREALAQVAAQVGGLDALVLGVVADRRGSGDAQRDSPLEIQTRLIDLKDNSLVSVSKEPTFISLSDAAYMGESWELRRWSGDRLDIVGLRNATEGPFRSVKNVLYGTGMAFDRALYSLIRRDRPHPLLDPACAFRMAVVVDGQERPLVSVGTRVYSALDPGDTYWIRIQNRLSRPVYMSVFVDGINILGKKREHPATSAYWYLRPSYTSNLKGWYTGQSGSYNVEEFVITPASDAVAAGQGFGQQLGMITVVFYTIGMEGIPQPRGIAFSAMPGSFGTGAGRSTRTQLDQAAGPAPGLILAATTIYYAVTPRVEELRKEAGQ